MSFAALPEAWHPMVQAPAGEKRQMLSDPAWRKQARTEWDRVKWALLPHKHPERIRFVSVTDLALSRWVGATHWPTSSASRAGIPLTPSPTGSSPTTSGPASSGSVSPTRTPTEWRPR
jgi:hypothetical protein